MKILIAYLNKLDFALESLRKFSPDIEIVKFKVNPKKTKVVEEIFTEYLNSDKFTEDVMIWHPDMQATENWYEELMKYYDEFDVIGCKLVYPNGLIQHYGGAIMSDGRGCHPHQYMKNIGLTKPQEVAYVTGPGMVIKKKVWEKCKFDFQFNYYIDTDFCFQAREKGFSVGVVPVEIIHYEGEETLNIPLYEIKRKLKESHNKFVAKWMYRLVNKNESK